MSWGVYWMFYRCPDCGKKFKSGADTITEAAGEIATLNYRQFEDRRLAELAERIRQEAAALKE